MGSLAVVLARRSPPDPAVVTRMLGAAPHRGTATSVRTAGTAMVAVATEADWPDAWVADEPGVAAAFAGTLDNRAALARELDAAGFEPRANDPAHILLAAFRAWGEDAPGRLRGAFAGAVADAERGVVHCFRDHLGFGTLFAHDDARAFVAASEAKQVIAGAGIAREPDLEAVTDIFFARLDWRKTALKAVERIPRAFVISVSADTDRRLRRYWDPRSLLETARLSPGEIRERLVQLLLQAVERSVTGKDAVSLSGGLDSPTVAAFAAPRHLQLAGEPLLALSAVYPELPAVDERPLIELVVDQLGLRLETYVPSAGPLDDLRQWVDLLDGPWDTLLVPEVAEHYRRARALGARTILGGELAEYVYTMHQHLVGHLVLHGRWRAASRWALTYRRHGWSWWRIVRRAAPSVAPAAVAARYARFRGRDHRQLPPWIDPAQMDGLGSRPDLELPARQRWLQAQLDPVTPGAAVTVEADDICAALCGVQVRRPLADVDLWEFFLSLPAEAKFPGFVAKSLVREVMRGRLPDAVLDRRNQTVFDDHVLAAADYDGLRRWIFEEANTRIEGVDYELLRTRLERKELAVFELMWANDLARAHAFLGLWS